MISVESLLLETAANLAQQDWRVRHALATPIDRRLSVAWLWPAGPGLCPEGWLLSLAGAGGVEKIEAGEHIRDTPYGTFFQLQQGGRLFVAPWQGDVFGRLFMSDRPMPMVQPFRLRGERQSAWGLVWR